MKTIMKLLWWIVILWLVIGLIGAIRFSVTYDAQKTSFPNNFKTFMINTIAGPMGFL